MEGEEARGIGEIVSMTEYGVQGENEARRDSTPCYDRWQDSPTESWKIIESCTTEYRAASGVPVLGRIQGDASQALLKRARKQSAAGDSCWHRDRGSRGGSGNSSERTSQCRSPGTRCAGPLWAKFV